MKVCINTIMYKRWDVFNKVYAKGVFELIKSFPEIDFEVVIIGSTIKDKEVATNHGFTYHDCSNFPIGAKAQYMIEMSRKTNADFYLTLGSDDIMTPKTFEYCLGYMKQGYEHIAPYDIFYNYKGKLYHIDGYDVLHPRYLEPLIVGQILSKSILDRLDWQLFDKNVMHKGLDKYAAQRIKSANAKSHHYFCIDTDGYIVDFKTESNISKITPEKWQYIGKTNEYINYE